MLVIADEDRAVGLAGIMGGLNSEIVADTTDVVFESANFDGTIRDTFSPLLAEMEGGAIAQVCLRNNVRFVSVKSVSDHLFSDNQAEEYFDFGQALEALGRVVLPLAQALQKEEL